MGKLDIDQNYCKVDRLKGKCFTCHDKVDTVQTVDKKHNGTADITHHCKKCEKSLWRENNDLQKGIKGQRKGKQFAVGVEFNKNGRIIRS